MVTESTADEKKIPRTIAAPRLARLSASASNSATAASGGTIIKVTTKVLIRDRPNTGSCASRA